MEILKLMFDSTAMKMQQYLIIKATYIQSDSVSKKSLLRYTYV